MTRKQYNAKHNPPRPLDTIPCECDRCGAETMPWTHYVPATCADGATRYTAEHICGDCRINESGWDWECDAGRDGLSRNARARMRRLFGEEG